MKRFMLILSAVSLFSACSTEIDLLDDWKETAIIYGLLDQKDSVQYVRIQKAFLGPNNAFAMAQQYDSINYINTLDVYLEDQLSGAIFTLTPDTFYNKQPGDFYSPQQVIYSVVTGAGVLQTGRDYKLVVKNSATGNESTATTRLIENFNVSQPSGPNISFIKIQPTTTVEVRWNGAPSARIYQVAMVFYYEETDINNVTTLKATAPWTIGTVKTDAISANSPQSLKFDPDAFYRFVAQQVPQSSSVISRKAKEVDFIVYAGGEELDTYMSVNAPSSSLVQEKPSYTNIENGLGLFSARSNSRKAGLKLTPQSVDSLARGRFTCPLLFMDRNDVVTGCQ